MEGMVQPFLPGVGPRQIIEFEREGSAVRDALITYMHGIVSL